MMVSDDVVFRCSEKKLCRDSFVVESSTQFNAGEFCVKKVFSRTIKWLSENVGVNKLVVIPETSERRLLPE